MFDLRRLTLCLGGFICCASVVSLHAQVRANGYIDPAFTASCFAANPSNYLPRALFALPDGRTLVGGQFASPATCANGLMRIRTNGATDATFVSPLKTGDFVTCLATQSSGRIIAGGWLSDGTATFPVARLGTNGGMDATFQHYSVAPLLANALVVQPDDKIVAVGVGTGSNGFIARFTANGVLDSSFTNGFVSGVSSNGLGLTAIAIQQSKFIVGGQFKTYTDGVVTTNRDGLAWIDGNGKLDLLLRAPLTNADVRAILLQPDGKILVAGIFDGHEGTGRCLARLNADGTRDATFTSLNGLGSIGFALALQPDGKILLGHSFGVLRVGTNGVLDTTFGPRNAQGFLGTDATLATALALTPEGHLLVGAQKMTASGLERRGVIRLFAGLPPPPFITQQPQTQTVLAGTNAVLSVVATGAPPIFYQWRKNGLNIKGATNDTLVLTNVNSTATANYTVICTNSGGATTSLVARIMVEFFTSRLTIITNGVGAVLPDLTRSPLEIGRTYTVTARPATGFLFSNWFGGVTSSVPTVSFVMQSNLVLTVNFVPSPFIPVAGSYTGLFYDTNAPGHASAGSVALTLDARGGFKGTLKTGTRTRRFSGTFSLEHVAQPTIAATRTDPAVNLALEIDVVNGAIAGTVSTTNFNSRLLALRKVFSSRSNPAPNIGSYRVAFPGAEDATLAPAGDGFASFSVSTSGRVSGSGTLADNSTFTLLSTTVSNSWTPIYVSLYRGKGSLFGWVAPANGPDNDAAGTLWWSKPGTVGGSLYPGGFTNPIATLGSLYLAPTSGAPVITLTNGAVILSAGNLPEPLTNSITLGGDNKITGSNSLALTFSSSKGSLSGSFVDTNTAARRPVKGTVLQKQNESRGFFLGTNQSGRVFVGNAP